MPVQHIGVGTFGKTLQRPVTSNVLPYQRRMQERAYMQSDDSALERVSHLRLQFFLKTNVGNVALKGGIGALGNFRRLK